MVPSNPGLTTALADRYRIERELGQGGMATVYLARDLKHDRRVALKVLRPELAAVIGADRFLAEIKTTANLQHPHILPLHDSGEADGTVFYVMPYVEGESLRDRLNKEKQLPIDAAVRIAKETASALDYAHRHGIVHRDIKPENILLHDGQALVADFGIAFAVSRSDGGSRMTETGMSLGTPSYMAPEQAMGDREITQRADIYALGAVLYEMLTGEPPFTGATAQAIVARMVTEQPRTITTQRHTVPEHIEAAVMMALEKLPADRFATAADFAAALDNTGLANTRTMPTRARTQARTHKRDRVMIGLLLTTTIAASAGLLWKMFDVPAAPVSRVSMSFAAGTVPLADRAMQVSPDGARFAYVGPGDGNASIIWIKERSKEAAVPLPGTTNVQAFTFSPGGDWLAFVTAGQQLRKIPVNGGAAISLADTASPTRGLAWLDNGTILYVRNGGSKIHRIPDVGGPPTVVWSNDSSANTLAWYPSAIANRNAILFMACSGAATCPSGLAVVSLDVESGKTTLVANGALRGEFAMTGHVIYGRQDGAVLAIPFSTRSLAPTGSPVPLMDSITVTPQGFVAFTISRDGTMYTRTGATISSSSTFELVWIDRTGRESAIDSSFSFRLTSFGANAGWALSPSGDRVAIGLNTDAGDNVWVKHLPRGPVSRITFDSSPAFRPRWWRDGKTVVYTSRRGANAMLYKHAADGTGTDELVYAMKTNPGIYEGAWSPDGKTLALRAGGTVSVVGGRDIMIVQPGVDSAPRKLIASDQFDESGIALSPDGKWIAHESNETGRTEVYIRPFPNADAGKWQVSTEGGRAPLWSRNGRELFFVDGTRTMVSAPVTFGTGAQIGLRTKLFKLRDEIYLANQENYTPFDIAPDGRFLMARTMRTTAAKISPIVVTGNWFTELRTRLAQP